MKTQYASYEKASLDKVKQDYNDLRSARYINELVGALPYVATILNKERQIVFSNDALLDKMGLNMEELLGKRTGEALNCIHSSDMEAGCGTSAHCQVCGAINAILRCQETGKTATDECRIRVNTQDENDCLDLEVTATPFNWTGQKYVIFAARDISNEKRREALERVFFHDVINTAGTLQGLVDLLKQIDDPSKIREFIQLLSEVSRDLTEEILNQKSLLAAENGELAVSRVEFYLIETLRNIINEYRRHELAVNKEILLAEDPLEYLVCTDPVLLRRIIGNMIKNALEAMLPDEKVRISCEAGGDRIRITVHNPGTMPEPVKKQIFQRSFSTKGKGRGLGTYSMKLLGERYLGGKVQFRSDNGKGTEFSIILPMIRTMDAGNAAS